MNLLRIVLLALFVYLLWRTLKPYLTNAQKAVNAGRRFQKAKREAAALIDGKAPHEILGVAKNATRDEIVAAYRKRISEYHPDKSATLAPEIRALSEARTRQINRAYEILKAKAPETEE